VIDAGVETRVGKGLLIYDGDCGFCTRTAAWLRGRLPTGYRTCASQKLPNLHELGLDGKQVHEAAYWIDPDGTKHRGHRAILRAVEASRGALGPLAGAMKLWPFDLIAAGVYSVVARHRHLLPGGTDNHCAI
jgi:predicted DCC family thiol-disulfide oxidoreductase YuxK